LAGRLSHAATRVARSGANAARWRVDPR